MSSRSDGWAAAHFFVLRTPLLPWDELTSWSRALAVTSGDVSAEAIADDRRRLRERLCVSVSRPDVREALFVASPSLHASLPAWIEAPDSPRGKKVERTLVRYFTRMCARATPFGLFAGCSLGTVGGGATELSLPGAVDYRRHTRLDGSYLAALSEALLGDREVRRALRHAVNDSAYCAAGRVRFAEARLVRGERSFVLSAVDVTPEVAALLAAARAPTPFGALAQAVAAACDVAEDEAADFVDDAIAAQLLVPELQPLVTGDDPLAELTAQLRAAPAAAAASSALERSRAALAALDASPLGAPSDRYRHIADDLATLSAEVDPARLFQVDLMKPVVTARLGDDVVAEILGAAALLQRLSRARPKPDLARFGEAFAARYGQREVPLAEALDEDLGIGFGRADTPAADASPLVADLAFPHAAGDDEPRAGPHFAHLLARLTEALAAGAHEIVLDDGDATAMAAPNAPALPSSAAAMVTLAGPDPAAVAAGDVRIWLHAIVGPSGANLLGRFCHADAELTRHVRDYLAAEEATRPDALFAEIVHLPDGRIGNVLARPLLRRFEIPFLGRSGAPPDAQLPADDLLVSVHAGRVRLRSRRLGREVIPRLTSAHHHASPGCLGTYRFLCALQAQDKRKLAFDWGALAAAPYLPRVRKGRVVLSLARWRLGREELRRLDRGDGDEIFGAVQALRARRRLPRWVALVESDNVLPIDLDNVLAVETFAHAARGRDGVVLTELFAPEGSCVVGPEGRFVHEIVLPLAGATVAAAAPPPPPPSSATTMSRRSFPPGSEWLYLKLYSGMGAVDALLCDELAAVLAEATGSGAADGWFFLRYADDDWHLRLRVHGAPARLRAEVQPRLDEAAAAAMARGLVWRVQLDTYEREVERYGGDAGMPLSEELFCADSDAALAVIAATRGDAGADARWRLTLLGIDRLLADVGLSLDERLALVRRCRASFAREHAVNAAFERQLGDQFRKHRHGLEALLAGVTADDAVLGAGHAAYAARGERLRDVAARLRAATAAGHCTASVDQLAASWVHMTVNRLTRSSARAQELVLYDFLQRLYEGQQARRRAAR